MSRCANSSAVSYQCSLSGSQTEKSLHKTVALLAVASSAALFGCSSGSNEASGAPGTGSPSGSGGTQIDDLTLGDGDLDSPELGVGDGDGSVMETYDGGVVPLTEDQLDSVTVGSCANLTGEASRQTPVLQLVVDVSTSMGQEAPGNAPLTKWEVTRDAILDALDALPDEMPVGLQFYPTGGGGGRGDQGGECVGPEGLVPIAPLGPVGDAQRTALATAVESATLSQGTPTHDAFVTALEDSLELDMSGARKFMLLITDGAPSRQLGCSNLDGQNLTPDSPAIVAIIDEIAAAHANGIDSYIIGSPGSESGSAGGGGGGADMRPWLSEAAIAGGTAPDGCMTVPAPSPAEAGGFCHFDMTQAADFGAELAAGLANIAGAVSATCDFQLPESVSREDVNLSLASVVVQWSDGSAVRVIHDEVGDCQQGWKWSDAGGLQLCPATCADVQSDAGAVVNVALDCVDIIR